MDRTDALRKYQDEVNAELSKVKEELQQLADIKDEIDIRIRFLSSVWQNYPGFNNVIQAEIETLTNKLREIESNSAGQQEKQRRTQYLETLIREIDATLNK